jgi:hypothetical protein
VIIDDGSHLRFFCGAAVASACSIATSLSPCSPHALNFSKNEWYGWATPADPGAALYITV